MNTVRERPSQATRLNRQTHTNLQAAMRVESLAYTQLMLFARQARIHGKDELAALFEEAATDQHLKRFELLAGAAGLINNDFDNLCDTIAQETDGTLSMYQRFAGEAAMTGDSEVQELFLELSKGQMLHEGIFRTAVTAMDYPGRDMW